MKIYFSILFLTCLAYAKAQYLGPVDLISTGYGSNGSYSVGHIDILNNHYLLKPISVFYPLEATHPVPTIFYSHGYASSDTSFHIETLKHIASKGYAVVFVPYKTFGVSITERYETLFDGFVKAARNNTTIIDTTKVGFFGQSFGGGATPWVSYKAFTELNWGISGKFIYCSAPWYSYDLDDNKLSNFPSECNLLTVLYNDDLTNDHRIGIDVFNNIAIDDSIKDCLIVYSDTIEEYKYETDHTLPAQYTNNGEFDALDYYVTFRLLDALADYSFTGNLEAKQLALGNGSNMQVDMGGELSNLSQSDNPSAIHPESMYINPCNDTTTNERAIHCQSIVGLKSASNTIESNNLIYPNPSNGIINIANNNPIKNLKVTVLEQTGEKISVYLNETTIDLSHLKPGTYIVQLEIDKKNQYEKLLITK